MTCRRSNSWARFVLLSIALELGACGGGGGGKPSSPTPTPTPGPTPPPSGNAGKGTVAVIESASIAQDGRTEAVFRLTDDRGEPIQPTLVAATGDQQGRVRLTIARLESYSGGGDLANTFLRYVNLVNETAPAYDKGGSLASVDAASGTWKYTFGTAVALEPESTYAIGMQVDRTWDEVEESANPVYDFVPSGGTPTIYSDTTTAQCNTCHAPLIAHGNRREVRLCELCHTQAATDQKGTSIAFENMVHMIHAGVELPSIVDGPPGSKYAIYSSYAKEDVVFAEKTADGAILGVAFPRPIESCHVCHSAGPTAEFARTKPSTLACASCHDDVNPSREATMAGPPGTNHRAGAFEDGQCAGCHRAEMSKEFDISVPGAHVVPEQSTQLPGLNITLKDVANGGAGQTPTVTFTVTDDAGTPLRDFSQLNRLAFTAAGPTTDYLELLLATAVGSGSSGKLSGPDAAGVWQYTMPKPIPASATGSWSIGAEARQPWTLSNDAVVNMAAVNPVVTFPVSSEPVEQRRKVVDDAKCFECHGPFSKGFSVHGNLRNRVDYCVMCHDPNQSDASRRSKDPEQVAKGAFDATIDLKVMIHKIHRGENLAQKPYEIYGFGPTPPGYSVTDFAEVLYPGNLASCLACHAKDTYLIPPYPGTAVGTLITHLDPSNGSVVPDGRLGPITAVCSSCHDSDAALAHIASQTSPNAGESCSVCHGEGREFAVSEVHAKAAAE